MAQKSREGNRDLQIQLDQALQQAQDPNSKGNSLFAEVMNQPCLSKIWNNMHQNAWHTRYYTGV